MLRKTLIIISALLIPGIAGAMTVTELAGNSLSEYPYFEYVKAFNVDAKINIAIDPNRFPGIAGLTCDIYVVNSKTTSEWTFDPSLIDVTAGGFSTQTFSAGTIQVNTFLVTGPSELSADAGIGLGVGYDVVIDVNRNGQLDAPDYIDGYDDNEAGLYVTHLNAVLLRLPRFPVTVLGLCSVFLQDSQTRIFIIPRILLQWENFHLSW